jgi:hypothetical protein
MTDIRLAEPTSLEDKAAEVTQKLAAKKLTTLAQEQQNLASDCVGHLENVLWLLKRVQKLEDPEDAVDYLKRNKAMITTLIDRLNFILVN